MSDLPDSTPIIEMKKRGGGRPRKVDLVGTLHEAFKAYQDFYADMSPIEICLMGAVRVAPRYESVQKVLKAWDEIPKRDRRRITILDERVRELGIDLDEFKGLCKIGVNSALKEESDTMIATAEPKLIRKSLNVASTVDDHKERAAWLQSMGRHLPPPGQTTNINVANVNNPKPALMSFDEMMQLGGGETKALPPASVDGEIVKEGE